MVWLSQALVKKAETRTAKEVSRHAALHNQTGHKSGMHTFLHSGVDQWSDGMRAGPLTTLLQFWLPARSAL
jgi:hypothetical protein